MYDIGAARPSIKLTRKTSACDVFCSEVYVFNLLDSDEFLKFMMGIECVGISLTKFID